MINNELLGYIKNEITKGHSLEAIKAALRGGGWSEEDLQEAFNIINLPSNSSVPKPLQDAPTAPAQVNPVFAPIHNFENSSVGNTFTQTIPPRTSKNKTKALIISMIVALLLAGGGAYAYYNGTFVTLSSLVDKSFAKVEDVKSFSMDTTITLDFSEATKILKDAGEVVSVGTASKFTMTIKGEYDMSDEENFKNSSQISISAEDFSLTGEIRIIGDSMYAQITKAPTIAALLELDIENKWISFPTDSKDEEIPGSPSLSDLTGVNVDVTEKLTEEQKDYLNSLAENASFIKELDKLSPEEILGETSYHFRFDLDREGIKEYLKSVEDYIHSVGKDDSAMSSFETTSFSKDLDQIKDFQGEVWIGRKDKIIRKLDISLSIPPEKDSADKIKVRIVTLFSNRNKPVTVEAPKESTSVKELFQGILGVIMEESMRKSIKADSKVETKKDIIKDSWQPQQSSIQASLSNFQMYGEFYYEGANSYNGFCSSINPLVLDDSLLHQPGQIFICKEASASWATEASDPKAGSYWCVDSAGFSGKMSKEITGPKCK